MNDTGLEHPLVREYLRDLDAALASLPASRADELRDQITAHLDDVLRPGADDSEVAAALSRLGSPADLAAEAGAGTASTAEPAPRPPVTFASLAAMRLARVRKRTWAVAAVIVVLLGAGIGGSSPFLFAGSLVEGTSGGWWFAQDYDHAVYTTVDGAQQTTVPLRDGHEQGFAIDLYNPTSFTQTVLGPAGGSGADSPGAQTSQLGVSVPNQDIDNGGFIRQVRFTLPGSIPPHQERLVRLLWVSDVCMPQGGDTGIDALTLRVRVAWFTRTETVQLLEGWYLSGPGYKGC